MRNGCHCKNRHHINETTCWRGLYFVHMPKSTQTRSSSIRRTLRMQTEVWNTLLAQCNAKHCIVAKLHDTILHNNQCWWVQEIFAFTKQNGYTFELGCTANYVKDTHWPCVTQREDCCLIKGRGCPFAVSLASKGWNDKHLSSRHRASGLSNKQLGRHAYLTYQGVGSEEIKGGLDYKTNMQTHKQHTRTQMAAQSYTTIVTHRKYTQEITTFTNSESTSASLTKWAHAW